MPTIYKASGGMRLKWSTNDMGRDFYNWEGCNGPSEFMADVREQDFIQWATDYGYETADAVLVMAECGDDGDCPMVLIDGWQWWSAGYSAGINAP